jgi:DNA-binding beta-propeller fold protein YncE
VRGAIARHAGQGSLAVVALTAVIGASAFAGASGPVAAASAASTSASAPVPATATVAARPPGPAPLPAWTVVARVPIPGAVRWDYVNVDPGSHRLYIGHATQVEIVDTRTDTVVGQLADTHGVHGAAVAPDLGRAFSSDGADGQVGVYDLASGARLASVRAGTNPDAIVYEPVSKRVVALNGRSFDATVIDAKRAEVVAASVPVGGKPEYAVVDGRGLVYFNVEDQHEIVVFDAAAARVKSRYSIAPCEEPSGLAIDPAGRLWSGCGNEMMVVSDPATGRVLGHAPIGEGVDGVVWFEGRGYAANGRDGTVSVVAETAPGRFETVATVPTALGARTIAVDPVLRKLYLPTATYAVPPATPSSRPRMGTPSTRPVPTAGTFHVLVLGDGNMASAAAAAGSSASSPAR